jgi:hypothetical protein
MNNFKIGDKVVFINNNATLINLISITIDFNLILGKTYTVTDILFNKIDVNNRRYFIYSERFILLSEYRKRKLNKIF